MKFDLKLFVLVGILAGIIVVILFGGRGVKPVEKKDVEFDDDMKEKTLGEKEAAPTPKEENAVIKAVYETGEEGYVKLINDAYSDKLDFISVKKENDRNFIRLRVSDLQKNNNSELSYQMKRNVKYEVCFTFKKDAKVDSIASMFVNCAKLTKVDLGNFVVGSVTDMSSMFLRCCALQEVSFGHFDSSNVTDMSDMFLVCSSLSKVDFGNFNTQNVENMSNMFSKCSALTKLNLSSFDTSNVTDMATMFNECSSLKELNLSTFNTENVENMSWMFGNCSSLKELNLSSFNTEKVEDMSHMFYHCSALEKLNLGNFNFTSVVSVSEMFSGCSVLKTFVIPQQVLYGKDDDVDFSDVFKKCHKLKLNRNPNIDVISTFAEFINVLRNNS